MKSNEMEILKSFCVRLSDSLVMLLTYQYHSEKNSSDEYYLSNAIFNKEKSRYRFIGRIADEKTLRNEAAEMMTDENRLNGWVWPNDSEWKDGRILYSGDSSNYRGSLWIMKRLKNPIAWDDWLLIVSGMKKDTNRKSKTYGKYVKKPVNIVPMDVGGYITDTGDIIDLTDLETLKTLSGKTFWKNLVMKSKL